MKKIYYFDNAATTMPDPRVVDKMLPYLKGDYGNPSSIHTLGRRVKASVERAREEVATRLNISPSQFIFTGSGSEANNLAILGLIRKRTKGHIISSNIEHSSVYELMKYLEKKGFDLTFITPEKTGEIDPQKVINVVRDDTFLVSLMGVNNETGVINPIEKIGKSLPGSVLFHVDMIQMLGKVPFDLSKFGVAIASFAGHKIHGPKGIGGLYIRHGLALDPLMHGGGQEMDRRPGTENTANIMGFAEAVRLLDEPSNTSEIRDLFEETIQSRIQNVSINGGTSHRAPHVSNIRFGRIAGDSLLINLDMKGLMASIGSACSSGSINPSKVLLAMGLSRDEALASIRFSFGRFNHMEEIEPACDIIESALQTLRKKR